MANVTIVDRKIRVEAKVSRVVVRVTPTARIFNGGGPAGLSAYELALEGGFVGTLSQWLASLEGQDGRSAYEVALDEGFVGSEAAWLASLQGPPGADGADGADGAPGASAYAVAVANGFSGTEAEWLASLAAGGAPDVGPLYVTGTGVDYTLPDDCPEIIYFTAADPADRVILPLPQDVPQGKRIVLRILGSNTIPIRVPTATSYVEGYGAPGLVQINVRGFEIDGTTPAWVAEAAIAETLREASVFALFTQSYNGLAPFYLGWDPTLVASGLDDGAMWMTNDSVYIRFNGETRDLLASAPAASPVLNWMI